MRNTNQAIIAKSEQGFERIAKSPGPGKTGRLSAALILCLPASEQCAHAVVTSAGDMLPPGTRGLVAPPPAFR